jgi:proline dehydrogenase
LSLLDRAIVRILPAVPKSIVRRIADLYIAGESLEDALETVRRLNAQAKAGTIDVLGEEIANTDEARAITSAYLDVLRGIEERKLDSNISVKPTALGLGLDDELWRENIETLVRDARERSNFVRIDMEDSSTTDATLRTYRELRESGHDNVGVVLQTRLRRTLDDIAALADLRPNVRICKGIYLEPESIAYTRFDEIRASFVRCLEALRETASYVGVATHDEYLIDAAKRTLHERYEFQMLLGVRERLGDALVRDGYPLRIYVPFGRQWYEYSLRRLQENPRIAGYIAKDTVRRIF